MLTKGYIIELATKTNNKYKVRIPLFDSAGQDTLTNNDNVVEATLCYDAGILNNLKVNDCVFVEFENDEESKPVILGKLYISGSNENRGLGNLNTLNVSSSAVLPSNTTLGGVGLQAFVDNLALSKTNSERIDQIASESISKLESQVDTNTKSITRINSTITVSNGISKGYVYNRDDGVSEMGQYIDFHFQKSTRDYSTRISTQAANGNVLTLPTKSGTLATTSDITDITNTLATKSEVNSQISSAVTGLASETYVNTAISSAIKDVLNTSI